MNPDLALRIGHPEGPTLAVQRVPARKSGRYKLLIAARVLGASGQPWLWRQILGLDDFDVPLMCWERRVPAQGDPLAGNRVHVMQQDPAPYDGRNRWRHRFRNLPGRNFYAATGRDRREIAEVLEREGPDAVLCYCGDVAMRLLPVATRQAIPVIAYLHGDFLFRSNRWYRWSLQRCLRRFASIAVVTGEERTWLVHQGVPASRICVIPCGAPTAIFRPRERVDHEVIQFVMCSRLVAEKGCELTIHAFARVAAAVDRVRLQIFGDGPARPSLERLVDSLGLRELVRFHGYVPEADLAPLLAEYDVFVQHSLVKEGSPVSIAEAMACGLPVVATPVGGIGDQVIDGETGLLVRERDVVAMSAAMQRLALDAELRVRLGRAGRDRAVEAYESSRHTVRLAHLARTVMMRHDPRAVQGASSPQEAIR